MSDYKPDRELLIVSRDGDSARVEELLKAGADPNKMSTTDGFRALDLAARNGHNEVVKTLIQAGAKVRKKNMRGRTALNEAALCEVSIAISQGHQELVLNFLEKVPSPAKKGKEDYNNYFHLYFFFFQLIS